MGAQAENPVRVSVVMGSESDADTVRETAAVLQEFGVGYEARVLSAHRTPKELVAYVEALPSRGIRVIIAAAGMSAALAGAVAAHTTLPVIGIPMETKNLQGMDSLLSTVQMPKGIPVACMALGKAGARNAGIFACQILALQDEDLARKLVELKKTMAQAIANMTLIL